ncbi:hypothetical protein Droror1_Dr00000192 [Drosera rotundifolia]
MAVTMESWKSVLVLPYRSLGVVYGDLSSSPRPLATVLVAGIAGGCCQWVLVQARCLRTVGNGVELLGERPDYANSPLCCIVLAYFFFLEGSRPSYGPRKDLEIRFLFFFVFHFCSISADNKGEKMKITKEKPAQRNKLWHHSAACRLRRLPIAGRQNPSPKTAEFSAPTSYNGRSSAASLRSTTI